MKQIIITVCITLAVAAALFAGVLALRRPKPPHADEPTPVAKTSAVKEVREIPVAPESKETARPGEDFSDGFAPVIEINQALQGVWRMKRFSDDMGKTTKNGGNVAVARVSGSRVVLDGGKIYHVKQVTERLDANGKASTVIVFSDATIGYAVSDSDMTGVYLLQIFSTLHWKETTRMLISVD